MNNREVSILLSRASLFLIYSWFGFLKIIGLSPASGMVTELFQKTLDPLMHLVGFSLSPEIFIIIFGGVEVIIGILFILPGRERIAGWVFFAHMFTTTLPLFFLKESVWIKILVPTLEGQYIIKNIALIACAINIISYVKPKNKIGVVTM